ncbi:hypothetical protein ACEPAF_1579 [Sanghuangporus sanghuang]
MGAPTKPILIEPKPRPSGKGRAAPKKPVLAEPKPRPCENGRGAVTKRTLVRPTRIISGERGKDSVGFIDRLCEPCKKIKRKCLQRFASRVNESCDSCLKSGDECAHNDTATEESDPSDEEKESDKDPLRDVSPGILAELKHLDLSDFVGFNNNVVNGGAYGDICKAYCRFPDGRRSRVSMKRLRFYLREDITLLFEKEIYVWSKLQHVNILPLMGYAFDGPTGFPVLVSQWMPLGSAWSYLKDKPEFNPTRLVRGIARGLQYLHQQEIVHSDLKSDNVLLTTTLDARICDFGCSRMLAASRSLANMSSGIRGTFRYLAYELLATPASGGQTTARHTKETDVWAFGMTVYELLDRRRPYEDLAEFQVLSAILSGQLPSVSQTFHNRSPLRRTVKAILWEMCERCWTRDPKDRAIIDTILYEFEKEIENNGTGILRSYFYDDEAEVCDDTEVPNGERYSLSFLDSIAD